MINKSHTMSAYSSSEGMKVLLQKGALIKCDGMVTENGVVTMPSRLTVTVLLVYSQCVIRLWVIDDSNL